MSKRILVLSASVGAGHLRAAQAVALALQELDPTADVQNVDVLEYTTALFRRLYGKAYLDLVNHAPHMLGYFYDMLDRKPSRFSQGDRLRYLAQKLNAMRFLKFLKSSPWDIIVNTHFLPLEMIAHLRRKKKLNTPQVTVTTDFETHRLWIHQPCDHFFTATAEGAENLAVWGVPRELITVTGIPIHPEFSRPADIVACRAKHGVAGDRPVLLMLAGGFGVGPIERIYEGLLSLEQPVEVIAVSGKNEALRKKLGKISVPERHRAHVLGFTNDMHELMAVADLVLSKPGGLTTSEVLARGAAMAVVNPIPGQESRNSDFLLENGAAIKINNLATMPLKLNELLANPTRLRQLKTNARALGRPQAAFTVAQAVLNFPTVAAGK